MNTHIMLLLVFGVAVSSCATEPEPPPDQPQHTLLEGLEAPPLNRPITAAPTQPPEPDRTVTLQEGAPMLVLTVNGAAFTGRIEASGTVNVSDSGIDFSADDGRVVHIAYRAPAELSPLRAGDGDGAIRITDRSGPGGADRTLAIDRAGALLMGEIWQSSPEPIHFDLGSGLALQQGGAEAAVRQQVVAAPVDVLDGGRVVARVPTGEATTVVSRAGLYQVYLETSQVSAPGEPAGQFGGGYVLHAWIFRVEG